MKRKIIIILLLIISIVLLPIGMDKFIIGNSYYSNIDNDIWVNFLGSYLGSIIGSITTLFGIYITIKFTAEQSKKEREFAAIQANEDRRLQVAPYLKYDFYEHTTKVKYDNDIVYVEQGMEDSNSKHINAIVSIKNIGMAPIIDLTVTNIRFHFNSIDIIMLFDALEKNKSINILLDFLIRLDDIKEDELIERPDGKLVNFSKGGTLEFKINYNDLLGNEYEQDVQLTLNIAFDIQKYNNKREFKNPCFLLANSYIERPVIKTKNNI